MNGKITKIEKLLIELNLTHEEIYFIWLRERRRPELIITTLERILKYHNDKDSDYKMYLFKKLIDYNYDNLSDYLNY